MSLQMLLSRAAEERFGARIASTLADIKYQVVHVDDPAETRDARVDIAFLSRDITGKSTKFHLTETMQRFFDTLAASPALRWLQIHSAGTDRPVYPPLMARGVTITTSSGASARTMGVSVLGGMITLSRGFAAQWDAQKRRQWSPLDEVHGPPEFGDATAVVVGLGPIGREIARLLRAFGMKVTGVRRTRESVPECDEVLTFAELDKALPRADWLVLACPLTETTRGLIDAKALALLPPRARIVNVSRGEVVVEPDLIRALANGNLAGAWLDVFHHEPLDPGSPLWDLPNVIVSPHSSARSAGHYDSVGEIFLDNLARWHDGRALRNIAPTLPVHTEKVP